MAWDKGSESYLNCGQSSCPGNVSLPPVSGLCGAGCVAKAAAPAEASRSAVPEPDGETEGLAFSFVLAPRQDPSWTLVCTI